jgi:hypothetical protein
MVNIKGIDKAKVLAALFNNSKVQGMGFLQASRGPQVMNEATARVAMGNGDDNGNFGLYFDYLFGRVLKVNISGDEFDPWGYDRDLGKGAAQRAIDSIK